MQIKKDIPFQKNGIPLNSNLQILKVIQDQVQRKITAHTLCGEKSHSMTIHGLSFLPWTNAKMYSTKSMTLSRYPNQSPNGAALHCGNEISKPLLSRKLPVWDTTLLVSVSY